MLQAHAEPLHSGKSLQGGVEVEPLPGVMACGVGLGRGVERLQPPRRPERSEVEPGGDLPHPAAEGALPPIVANALEGGDQSVLREVVRDIRGGAHATKETPQGGQVPLDQDCEGPRVASRGAAGEDGVSHSVQADLNGGRHGSGALAPDEVQDEEGDPDAERDGRSPGDCSAGFQVDGAHDLAKDTQANSRTQQHQAHLERRRRV